MDATTPQEGQPAPSFRLPTGDGRELSLDDLRGKRVVLYFYPKDDTPGCTREACAFRDLRSEFAAKDAEIIGVSLDDAASHQAFSEKFRLPFTLLCDEQAEVSKKYGVYVLRERDGRQWMGIERTTFLINRDGTIHKVYPKVTVDGHVEELLEAVDKMPG